MNRQCAYCAYTATHIVFVDFGDVIYLCADHFNEHTKSTTDQLSAKEGCKA